MLQKKKDFILKAFKRNGFFGLINAGKRFFEQNQFKEKTGYNPTALQVEVTTACNLNCAMCEHTFMKEKGEHLNLSEFKKLIDKNKNIQVVNLTGIGEALLNPEFMKMIEYTKKKGLYVWFNDNFTLLDEKKAEKMLDLKVDFIVVSLDGATKETYEKIRNGADFNKVIANFKKLRELRDKRKMNKPKLGINSVVIKENYHEIEKLVKLAKELKADNLMFTAIIMSSNTGKLSLWNLEPEKVKPELEKAKKTAEELQVKVFSWPEIELKKSSNTGCAYPWVNPYIASNGDVIPCCFIPQMADARMNEENVMGNIKQESLKEIWNGKKYREFRKKIKTKSPPKACSTCSKFYGQ